MAAFGNGECRAKSAPARSRITLAHFSDDHRYFSHKSATRSLRRVSASSYSLTSIKVAKGLVRFCCRFLYGHSVRTVGLILQSSRTVGPLCGGGNLEELHQAGCISIYKDPAELIQHYDSSPLQ